MARQSPLCGQSRRILRRVPAATRRMRSSPIRARCGFHGFPMVMEYGYAPEAVTRCSRGAASWRGRLGRVAIDSAGGRRQRLWRRCAIQRILSAGAACNSHAYARRWRESARGRRLRDASSGHFYMARDRAAQTRQNASESPPTRPKRRCRDAPGVKMRYIGPRIVFSHTCAARQRGWAAVWVGPGRLRSCARRPLWSYGSAGQQGRELAPFAGCAVAGHAQSGDERIPQPPPARPNRPAQPRCRAAMCD